MTSRSGGPSRSHAIPIADDDENLVGLVGAAIPSEVQDGVAYTPEQALGRGGGSIAFLARRESRDGAVPVVVKVLRPSFVKKLGPTAHLLIKKEAVALGRLNERVPPTPFVIRLVDTGSVELDVAGSPIEVPWVAVEYVHGGDLGTTLAQRVRRSLRDSGFAFGAARAANAIDCIAHGLAAVHEVGVFHRDLTPNNVLCAGRGSEETLKIADFGVARPVGVQGSLAGALVGTPGFAAPELSFGADADIGPHTDVFSFASIIFFLLTGEPLFASAADVLRAMQSPARRSLLDMPGLAPELRARESACRSIDHVLAWASAGPSESRLSEALAVAAMVLPHLAAPRRERYRSQETPTMHELALSEPREWTWTVLQQPGHDLVIRSVAWDGGGRAIAATPHGLCFWSGTAWRIAKTDGLETAGGVRFVQRLAAGRWILGGGDASLAIYSTGGVVEIVEGPPGAASVEAFAGDLDDVAVLVTTNEAGALALDTYASKRWLRPVVVPNAASISAITRFDDVRFLVVGRRAEGGAYAALYSAEGRDLEEITAPTGARALLACAGRPRKSVACAVGTQGAVLSITGSGGRAPFGAGKNDSVGIERIEGEPSLSAAAFDPFGRVWTAAASRIFMRRDGAGWETAFEDTHVESPFVSLFLDVGLTIAMTADGAVIEGRSARANRTTSDLPPRPGG